MSKLAQAKAVMSCTTAELAALLDMSTPTVTAYIQGTRREYLNASQLGRLKKTLASYRDGVAAAVEALDKDLGV